MPMYEIRNLDTVGEPAWGYEVTASQKLGMIYLKPALVGLDEASTLEILRRLEKWVLPRIHHLSDEEDKLWHLYNDDLLNLQETEAGIEVRVTEFGGGEDENHQRPVLELRSNLTVDAPSHESELATFFTWQQDHPKKPGARKRGPCGSCLPPGILQDMNNVGETQRCDECDLYADDDEAQIALAEIKGYLLGAELSYYADTGRIGSYVVAASSSEESNVSDRFEWPIKAWMKRPSLGFNPLTGEELRLSGADLSNALVSLDKFMESQ
jgi:hypothetical protein